MINNHLYYLQRRLAVFLVSISLLLASTSSYAIAFCALRDPTHQIFDLFPEANAFSSLVDRIDRDVKGSVSEVLPFTLHNRELGQHTLYVALSEEQPLGLVHVRSESSDWGLIEIVWSLELDLTIRDFRFQRCRDSACGTLEEESFKSLLRGKNFQELQRFISPDQNSIDTIHLPVDASASNLAAAVLRSAMKTISVTELVWHEELAQLSD